MSQRESAPKPPVAAAEWLSPARFEEELRRVARRRPAIAVDDPLSAAVRKIEQNPAFTQSRLLTRILAALTYQEGTFRLAEVSAFDSATLSLAVTLMDAHAAGAATREDWVRAVNVTKAAQRGAED